MEEERESMVWRGEFHCFGAFGLSSPSYGDESEFIHKPSSSDSTFSSSALNWRSFPCSPYRRMRSLRLRLLRSSLSFSFAPAPVAAPEPGSARSPFGCGVEVKDLSQSSVMIELERLEGVRASFALLLSSSMLLLLLLCCSSNDI